MSRNRTRSYDSDEDLTPFVEYHIAIDSPRLKQACRSQGIEPKELHKKTLRDIKETHKNDRLNREGLILVAQHYEERRRAKVKLVLNERNRLIDQEEGHIPGQEQSTSRPSTAKGKTMKYNPRPSSSKGPKDRREIGEMIIRQQKEIDDLMRDVETVADKQNDPVREKARYSALNAHYMEKIPQRAIEVINNNEFHLSKDQLRMLRQQRNKKQLQASRNRQQRQQAVYAKEIEVVKTAQEKNRQKVQKMEHFNRLEKIEGNLLESRVVTIVRRNNLTPKQSATKQYFQDYLKFKQEEATKKKSQLDSAIDFAKKESEQWINQSRLELERSARLAEQRERKLGSALKKTLQEARNKPEIYRDIIQRPFFQQEEEEEEAVNMRPSAEYNADESSDEDWEHELYINPRSPLKGTATTGTWRPFESYSTKNQRRRKDEFDWYEDICSGRGSTRSGNSSDWFVMHQRAFSKTLDTFKAKGTPSVASQFVNAPQDDMEKTFSRFQSPMSTGSFGPKKVTF